MWREIQQVMFFPNKCIGFYTALFAMIWLVAWAINGVNNTHFDLDRFRDIYIWLMTQLNATHAINSIWNSPKGAGPVDAGPMGDSGVDIKDNIVGKYNNK